MRIGMLNAPVSFAATLGELPAGVTRPDNPEPGSLDLVGLFVRSLAELEAQAPGTIALVKYDGLLWICYPKKSSKIKTDINRDNGWEKMKTLGYAGVAMVAVDQSATGPRSK